MNIESSSRDPQSSASASGADVCLSIISAMARNRVIGRDNDLPWRLPEDMQHFMRSTLGKPVIMGRKTYESMGKPLPGRCNIVVSRSLPPPAGVKIAKSLEQALQQAKAGCSGSGVDEYFVIGGAQLYAASLPLAQRLYLTWVHADVAGDTFFPKFDLAAWREVQRQDFPASAKRTYPFSIVTYERAPASR